MGSDSYKTISAPVQIETKEKGSRFICHISPVTTRENAEEFIQNISKQYYDATHNCFAYSIGSGSEQITRFNDDGEPSGTAGRPILQTIQGRELTDIVVIVTRYFGGTKLGTGGLVRAYSGAAAQALDNADTITKFFKVKLHLEYAYDYTNLTMNILEKYQGEIDKTEYSHIVNQQILLRASLAADFEKQITNISAGQVIVRHN